KRQWRGHRPGSFPLLRSTLVEVQVGPAGDQSEDLADLLEAGAQEEVRVAAVALYPEDVEVRFRVLQGVRSLRAHCEAVAAALLEQCRRQGHPPQRGVALVDLHLAVEVGVGRVTDVGNDAFDVPARALSARPRLDAQSAVG